MMGSSCACRTSVGTRMRARAAGRYSARIVVGVAEARLRRVKARRTPTVRTRRRLLTS